MMLRCCPGGVLSNIFEFEFALLTTSTFLWMFRWISYLERPAAATGSAATHTKLTPTTPGVAGSSS